MRLFKVIHLLINCNKVDKVQGFYIRYEMKLDWLVPTSFDLTYLNLATVKSAHNRTQVRGVRGAVQKKITFLARKCLLRGGGKNLVR